MRTLVHSGLAALKYEFRRRGSDSSNACAPHVFEQTYSCRWGGNHVKLVQVVRATP